MVNQSIEQIRENIQKAETDAQKIHEYFKLINHPDVTWADYLDALDYRIIVGSPISIKLHEMLNVPFSKQEPIQTKDEWITLLQSRGIDIKEKTKSKKL